MPTRRSFLLALLLTAPHPALADYAPPPDRDRDRDRHDPFPGSREPERGESNESYPNEPQSTVRLYTGPALRLADEAARVGLLVAADVGAGPAGLRASGTFVGTGAAGGFALYAGELFIDFGRGNRLHPIVAAGAGLCRLEDVDAAGERLVHSIGVGLLRGTLQYRFAVEGVDARAGLDVSAQVRAFGAAEGTPSAWLAAAATVGVGF
jgi:hypothetical protein